MSNRGPRLSSWTTGQVEDSKGIGVVVGVIVVAALALLCKPGGMVLLYYLQNRLPWSQCMCMLERHAMIRGMAFFFFFQFEVNGSRVSDDCD